jgi:hypothetical protein
VNEKNAEDSTGPAADAETRQQRHSFLDVFLKPKSKGRGSQANIAGSVEGMFETGTATEASDDVTQLATSDQSK